MKRLSCAPPVVVIRRSSEPRVSSLPACATYQAA